MFLGIQIFFPQAPYLNIDILLAILQAYNLLNILKILISSQGSHVLIFCSGCYLLSWFRQH